MRGRTSQKGETEQPQRRTRHAKPVTIPQCVERRAWSARVLRTEARGCARSDSPCSPTTTMSSPSKPFDIPSPRRGEDAVPESSGTPNFGTSLSASPGPRFLRAQYTGTPPPPNIPLRSGATPIGTPRTNVGFLPGPSGESSSPAFAARPLAGTPGSGQPENPFDDLTDEEKARVLRRHLVSREERQTNRFATPDIAVIPGSSHNGSDSGHLSHRSSVSQMRLQREDTEPFPVPYDAPGADIT